MEGVLFTLVCSFFAAFYFIINDIFKLRGDVFVFWRSAWTALFLLPVIPFLVWDYQVTFYLAIAGAAVFAALGDMFMFNATRKHSAAALSRIIISRNILLFCLWPFILDGYWERLIANSYVFWGSCFFILLSTFALFKMRHNPVSVAVIMAGLPVIVFLTFCDLLFAWGINGKPGISDAIIVTFISGVVMSLVSGLTIYFMSIRKGDNSIMQGRWLGAGIVNGALFIGVSSTKSVALAHLENPGYFGAMVAVYTLWIFLLHKYWLKQKDLADPRLGFIVVLCSIALGILALQIPK